MDAPSAADWTDAMRRGDFAAAWAINDRMRAAGVIDWSRRQPRSLQSIWNGAPVDGRRVLVRCYHGLGDTIQFARFARPLRQRACHVTMWAQPALIPLLSTVAGIDALLPLHDGEVHAEHDVDVELMELPYLFRTTLDDVPAEVPYVFVDAERRREPEFAVGLVWKAGDWAPHRSIPFAALSPLTALPATWYVLQGEPGIAERPAGFGIVKGTHDIVEAARVMRSLDLVITIDSLAAHLAGALGTPVWTLLPADADWRWMTGRDDSPWYPTMRLFRQERAGDWTAVIARAAAALEALLDGHRQRF